MGKVWEEKKPIGDRCEKILDTFFTGKGLSVKKVGEETDRLGIDRIFENSSGMKYSVEYKSDLKAKTTGNFFVELRQRNENDGWAYSCISQRLVLYIPGRNEVYILRTERLKDNISAWNDRKSNKTEDQLLKGLTESLDALRAMPENIVNVTVPISVPGQEQGDIVVKNEVQVPDVIVNNNIQLPDRKPRKTTVKRDDFGNIKEMETN